MRSNKISLLHDAGVGISAKHIESELDVTPNAGFVTQNQGIGRISRRRRRFLQ
jgi:hypothetical protein